MARLSNESRILRTDPLSFSFNGREYSGFRGDTLASALLANDVSIVGRSFKYHRPRGVMACGDHEPNALVQLNSGERGEPNVKSTCIELYERLVARSVHCWPSVDFDIGEFTDLASAILPAGFYYKTFMGWPGWMFYERMIRRAAGLGTAPATPDPDAYLKLNAECDLLIVGAGPTGLAAAEAALGSGARVIVIDDQPEPGGSLLSQPTSINGSSSLQWVAGLVAAGETRGGFNILSRTSAVGYYDHNTLVALERLTDHIELDGRAGLPRQRLWSIRAAKVILATGAHERPIVFPNNDRPGIMLVSAVRDFALRYSALSGESIYFFSNNDSACVAAKQLISIGVKVSGIIDTRPPGTSPQVGQMRALGVKVFEGHEVSDTAGHGRVRAIRISPVGAREGRWLDCDSLGTSGGWNPAVHLFSQSGGRLRYDAQSACFVPDRSVQREESAGAAAGRFELQTCLDSGFAAGIRAASSGKSRTPPKTNEIADDYLITEFWRSPLNRRARSWVDFQNDVTDGDIALSARENFVSVEHLKRYTTTGMATDQGKTSNVNAIGVLGTITDRTPGQVGTTRFRPPYTAIPMSAVASGASGPLWVPRRLLQAHSAHEELNAAFAEFGNWLRPDYYLRAGETPEAAARREHLAVRQGVGMFDGSPIGKVHVVGPDAPDFLNRIYANNVANLEVGRIRYGLMLNENGVVIDDGVFARLAQDSYLLSPSSGAATRIAGWLEEWRQCEYPGLNVHVVDVTSAWAVVAVAGSQSRTVLQELDSDIKFGKDDFPHMTFREGTIQGLPARVLRVSFTGELQFELQVPSTYGEALWREVLRLGSRTAISPIGMEAWLRLRLEKGYIHVGSDTDGMTIPDDIGYGAAIARKTTDFVGRRSLSQPAARSQDREQLVGLTAPSPTNQIPVGACVMEGEQKQLPATKIGRVTSSCYSPFLNQSVALAMIKGGRSRVGSRVNIYANREFWSAEICAPIFHDVKGERLHG